MGSVVVLKGGLLRRWMIDEECRRVALLMEDIIRTESVRQRKCQLKNNTFE